ncbi:rhomboid family intramembrane serine protease [Pedobacter duraquae]|uniref:Rhomboid family protein n=1 Tax=Pedobacter duraquae TaxID=425511 RepID=A0A4R6IL33_9SPHI|nr:rhomboid family intramembrane serine protease [Pedobacter duraquae]TDO22824.1 rhomboid family protein [Pedobacter duraquae]
MSLPFTEIPFTYTMSAFLLTAGIIGLTSRNFYNKLRFHPYAVFRGDRTHTLLTSAFIHNNLLHLLFNTYIFYLMSYDIEYVLLDDYPKWAVILFMAGFFCSATVAINLFNGWFHKHDFKWTSAGSSGAVMAFVTFSTIYKPLDHLAIEVSLSPIYYSYHFCLAFLTITFLFTFIRSRHNHYAHFYGSIFGILMAVTIRPFLLIELLSHFKKT